MLESLRKNILGFVLTVGLVSVIGESFMDVRQRRLDRRTARNRRIVKEIRCVCRVNTRILSMVLNQS